VFLRRRPKCGHLGAMRRPFRTDSLIHICCF
jgi:hypothetical protein